MEEENEQYYELSTDGWIVKHRPTLNTNVLNEQGRFDPVKAMFDTSDDITYFIACPRIVDEEFSDVNNFKEWPLSFYLRYIVQTESLPTCDLGMYLSRIEDFGEPYYVLDLFEESELEKNPKLKERFKDVPLPTDPFLPYNCSGFIAALINLARNYKYYRLAQFESNPHCPIRLSELDFYLFDIYPEFYQAYYDHVWSYYKQNYHYLYLEINDDGVDPYMYSTEKLFYDDFTNSLIYNEFPEDQRKRIQKYFNAFMLFLKNRIGYDPEEQETEQKEELPQPEPEQLQKKHKNIEPFKFVDDSVVDIEEKRNITERIINLVTNFPVQMICEKLRQLQKANKLFIPGAPNDSIYNELIRLGMPGEDVDGFSRKNFNSWYYKAKQDDKAN